MTRYAMVALLALLWASQGHARTIITNDPGGSLDERLRVIEQLRGSNEPIEIRGWCASACTLYLGLPQTCVQPSATLGFHGPQSQFYGLSLPPEDFEYWSQIMASHYPRAIRQWFLVEGRYEIIGVFRLTGRQAIHMGAREC